MTLFLSFFRVFLQVENMAYFECAHHTKHYIFGRGGKQKLLSSLDALPQGGAGGLREEVEEAPLYTLPLVSQDEEGVAGGGGLGQLEGQYDAIARGMVERLFSMQANLYVVGRCA
ncbi:hypothetical protein EON65_15790 [archaeon]|nr:MAG: hypothetical protein EON65_15790 [archaeon]